MRAALYQDVAGAASRRRGTRLEFCRARWQAGPRMSKPWNQQQALVTGAASGLGLAIARKLRGLGARVILFDLDRKGLEDASRNLPRRRCARRSSLT